MKTRFTIDNNLDLIMANQLLDAHKECLESLTNEKAANWTKNIISELETAIKQYNNGNNNQN